MWFEKLIRPAVLRLLTESQGVYRNERDLHHHFTTCLNAFEPLRLGRVARIVRCEEPTKAKYRWSGGGSKAGNIDFCFRAESPGADHEGTAVELNLNYDSPVKIEIDFIKLIDPRNAYEETVYFAYGIKARFKDAVTEGLQRAFNWFKEDDADFLLPVELHILVVENQRWRSTSTLWETRVMQPSLPNQLRWAEMALSKPQDNTAVANSTAGEETAVLARSGPLSRTGNKVERAWYYWEDPHCKGYFLAFVNAKGSCSMRKFAADSGTFLGKSPNAPGDFREVFRDYIVSGTEVFVSHQPNLEKDCKERLPSPVLAELKRQIPKLDTSHS